MAENTSKTSNPVGEDITLNVEMVGDSTENATQQADNVNVLKKAIKDAHKAQQDLEKALYELSKQASKKKQKKSKKDESSSSSSSSTSSSESSDCDIPVKHKKGKHHKAGKSRSLWEKHGRFNHHPFGFPMMPHQHGGPHHHHGPHHRGPHHHGPHHRGPFSVHHHGALPGAHERLEFLRRFSRGNGARAHSLFMNRGRGFAGHGDFPWRHFEGAARGREHCHRREHKSRRSCGQSGDELSTLLESCWPAGDYSARGRSCPRI